MTFDAARHVLDEAVSARAFPGASIEVGTATRVLWRASTGRLTFDASAPAVATDTIYDLASLTKVLATTTLLMQQAERGVLDLDDVVGRHLEGWDRLDRADVTIRDLLTHCAGLPAWRPYFRDRVGRGAFEEAIRVEPLEYAPRSRSVYSDLGFMLLGFLLDGGVTLRDRVAALFSLMSVGEEIAFNPPSIWRARIAPTEHDAWRGHLLVGEVHDENAWALGGVAGHAGLFGTAAAVGACARHLLQILEGRTGVVTRSTLAAFVVRRADVPGSSRALGWDTMLPTSSCGTRLSPRAFGHTGFTGTSLWIDPERPVYVALLTNRVYPTRNNEAIQQVRRAVHDAVIDALD